MNLSHMIAKEIDADLKKKKKTKGEEGGWLWIQPTMITWLGQLGFLGSHGNFSFICLLCQPLASSK